jgi:hypothetical protein
MRAIAWLQSTADTMTHVPMLPLVEKRMWRGELNYISLVWTRVGPERDGDNLTN